jgi:hypothetical protein
LFAGWKAYSSGVVFARMNGAVDVYQENITPSEDGRLLEIKVERGQRVEPGTVVAVMDSSPYKMELEGLKREVLADRVKDIREYDQEILKLESELRKIDVESAEDEATIKGLENFLKDLHNHYLKSCLNSLSFWSINFFKFLSSSLEILTVIFFSGSIEYSIKFS